MTPSHEQTPNNQSTTGREPLEVFVSYAHEDEGLLHQLEKHLSLLKRQGVISTWHDRQIVAEWIGSLLSILT